MAHRVTEFVFLNVTQKYDTTSVGLKAFARHVPGKID